MFSGIANEQLKFFAESPIDSHILLFSVASSLWCMGGDEFPPQPYWTSFIEGSYSDVEDPCTNKCKEISSCQGFTAEYEKIYYRLRTPIKGYRCKFYDVCDACTSSLLSKSWTPRCNKGVAICHWDDHEGVGGSGASTEDCGASIEGPEATTGGPKATTDEPDATTNGPGSTVERSEATTGRPRSPIMGPEATTDELEVNTEEPQTTVKEPGATTEGLEKSEGSGTTSNGPEATTDGTKTTEGPKAATEEPGATTGSPGENTKKEEENGADPEIATYEPSTSSRGNGETADLTIMVVTRSNFKQNRMKKTQRWTKDVQIPG